MSSFLTFILGLSTSSVLSRLWRGSWKYLTTSSLNPNRTLIFDDLERSPLWKDDKDKLLGAINVYVEHRGFRTIVICHDKKIEEHLAESAEKIFGHRIAVEPDTASALDAFIADIKNETAQKFIKDHRTIIEKVWEKSTYHSLRMLKYLVSDIARFYQKLPKTYLEKTDTIEELIKYFCIFNIEIRAENLSREELEDFSTYWDYEPNKLSLDPEPSNDGENKHQNMQKKYIEIIDLFSSSILSPKTFAEMLFDSHYDRETIYQSFEQKFKPKYPWMKLKKFYLYSDKDLECCIAKTEEKLKEGVMIDIEAFMHLALFLLKVAKHKSHDLEIRAKNIEEEKKRLLEYSCNKLQIETIDEEILKWDFEDYNPYNKFSQYTVTKSSDFEDIKLAYSDIFESIKQRKIEQSYLAKNQEILTCLNKGPKSLPEIYTILSSSRLGYDCKSRIDAGTFWQAWCDGPKESWCYTAKALGMLFKANPNDAWITTLETNIKKLREKATGFDAWRLEFIHSRMANGLPESKAGEKPASTPSSDE